MEPKKGKLRYNKNKRSEPTWEKWGHANEGKKHKPSQSRENKKKSLPSRRVIKPKKKKRKSELHKIHWQKENRAQERLWGGKVIGVGHGAR